MNKRWRKPLGALLLLTLLAGTGAGLVYRDMERTLKAQVSLPAPVLFEIARGQGISSIAAALAGRGWLGQPLYLRLEAARLGVAARLQAGVYEIENGMTPREMLQRFVRGDIKRYRYTVVEGITFEALRQQIAALPGIRHRTRDMDGPALMRELGAEEESPEGRFFPATYEYVHHAEDLTLYRQAYREMRRVLQQAWAARAPGLPYQSPDEALIMASIIEKETGLAAERTEIAGVFVRRLQRGMRLQTDPTVIYGLGAAFDGNLRKADLRRDTPFNTYTRGGLPPTPIALPGRAAIEAALNPAPGDALYFVARGDGSHAFSATLGAHQRAVREFQLK